MKAKIVGLALCVGLLLLTGLSCRSVELPTVIKQFSAPVGSKMISTTLTAEASVAAPAVSTARPAAWITVFIILAAGSIVLFYLTWRNVKKEQLAIQGIQGEAQEVEAGYTAAIARAGRSWDQYFKRLFRRHKTEPAEPVDEEEPFYY